MAFAAYRLVRVPQGNSSRCHNSRYRVPIYLRIELPTQRSAGCVDGENFVIWGSEIECSLPQNRRRFKHASRIVRGTDLVEGVRVEYPRCLELLYALARDLRCIRIALPGKRSAIFRPFAGSQAMR